MVEGEDGGDLGEQHNAQPQTLPVGQHGAVIQPTLESVGDNPDGDHRVIINPSFEEDETLEAQVVSRVLTSHGPLHPSSSRGRLESLQSNHFGGSRGRFNFNTGHRGHGGGRHNPGGRNNSAMYYNSERSPVQRELNLLPGSGPPCT